MLNLISGCCCDFTLATVLSVRASSLTTGLRAVTPLPGWVHLWVKGRRREERRKSGKLKEKIKALDFLWVVTCCCGWQTVRAGPGRGMQLER